MKRSLLFVALLLTALPFFGQTDTPTPTSTPTITNTPTITLTPTPTSTRTITPTPIPPGTVQITGLPDGVTVVDGDEFPIDKLVSAVRRTRKVTALEIFDYIRQQSIIFTGIITINGIIILPDGSAPDPLDCDSAPEEDGRVFIDTSNPSGAPQLCICNGVAGWNCTTAFGASIDDTELTAEDFGSFTCTGSEDQCLLDSGSVGSTEIANGSVTTTDIADGTITEPDLSITNSASAGNALTSDGGTGFTWVDVASLGVAGSDTQVQFNDGGAMAGDAGLTYNKSTNVLTITGGAVQGADAAGPALLDEAASATNPTLLPNRAALDDGMGWDGTGGCPVLVESGSPIAKFCAGDISLGTAGLGANVTLKDNGAVRFEEAQANGSNYIGLTAPASLSSNLNCVFRDDSRMIPASCVEDNFSGSGSALVGGSDTQVQFNDSSTFGGDAGLTYNKTTNALTGGGDWTLTDGSGDSPSLIFTPQTGPSISLYALDTANGALEIETNDASDTLVNIDNAGAGEADLFVRGDIAADDLISGNTVQANVEVRLPDEVPARWYEDTGSGTNYVTIQAPASLSADRSCTFQDAAAPIPDSCVGDGTDDDDPESINLATASMVTGIADDQVLLGASADTAAFATVPNCTTGKLLYTQSTNTWSCGTDAVGFGGGGTGEYSPDNYPASGLSGTGSDEFTVVGTPTQTWTQRNADTQSVTYDMGAAILGPTGNTDAWHGITTPSLGDVDQWIVAKVETGSVNLATRGCGISLIHEGTAAAPTEIDSIYVRATSGTAAAVEFLSHDDYDFASPVSIATDVVSASGPDTLGTSLRFIYFMLGWVAATDDITAAWSWDGYIWRSFTTDTTAVSPVAIGLFSRDDEDCDFQWIRVFTTTPQVTGTASFKVGS